jgi:hypothetical protein
MESCANHIQFIRVFEAAKRKYLIQMMHEVMATSFVPSAFLKLPADRHVFSKILSPSMSLLIRNIFISKISLLWAIRVDVGK